MSSETLVERKPLKLRDLVYSQNGSWQLTNRGKAVLELSRTTKLLSNDCNSRITFAISPSYRQELISRRDELAQQLGIDSQDKVKLSKTGRKITQITGIFPHQIFHK